MSDNQIKLFNDKQVRTSWNEDEQEWYFSVVDVVEILTDQPNRDRARNYWKVLKSRLKKEGNESVTKCNQLKLESSDKKGTRAAHRKTSGQQAKRQNPCRAGKEEDQRKIANRTPHTHPR
jgi:hypothetical protein